MSTTKTATQATRTLSFTKILAGIAQHITAAIILGGKSLTPQALSAIFNAYLQAQADLDAARLVVMAKEQARDAALAAAEAMVPPLRSWAEASFGHASPILPDFGFKMLVATTRTAASKAASAAKAKATRAAHKAALAAAAPAPAPAPAPATPAAKA